MIIFLDSYDEIYPHPTLKNENYCKQIFKEIPGGVKVKFIVACRDYYLEKLEKKDENKIFSIKGEESD